VDQQGRLTALTAAVGEMIKPDISDRNAGSDAEQAADSKVEKYSTLERTGYFEPIADESSGLINAVACSLFVDLGRKISLISSDHHDSSALEVIFIMRCAT